MNKHTLEMLHDEAVHEGIRRFELIVVVAATIMILHGILYHTAF